MTMILRIPAIESVLFCLQFVAVLVAGEVQHNLTWNVEELRAINNTVMVELGDTLVLKCLPNSFSNLIALSNVQQFNSCNASGPAGSTSRRGYCTGLGTPLVVHVKSLSETLGTVLNFNQGGSIYLTSFSQGTSLVDAFSTNYMGGECDNGLKLTLRITPKNVTTTASPTSLPTLSPHTTTTTKPSGIKTSEGDDKSTTDKSTKEVMDKASGNKNLLTPAGLFSSSKMLTMFPSLLCTLTLVSLSFTR